MVPVCFEIVLFWSDRLPCCWLGNQESGTRQAGHAEPEKLSARAILQTEPDRKTYRANPFECVN